MGHVLLLTSALHFAHWTWDPTLHSDHFQLTVASVCVCVCSHVCACLCMCECMCLWYVCLFSVCACVCAYVFVGRALKCVFHKTKTTPVLYDEFPVGESGEPQADPKQRPPLLTLAVQLHRGSA